MGIPSGFAAYAPGDPGGMGIGVSRPLIFFVNIGSLIPSGISLNLARAIPWGVIKCGNWGCVLSNVQIRIRFSTLKIKAALLSPYGQPTSRVS